jgi:glycosyltransferase involved in cell wall biosynthesis
MTETGDPELVTVVIPTRNRATILRHTIQSILRQEDVRISIVVVDDASSDGTSDVVRSLPEVQLIRHESVTEQRIARNHGASVATSDWIAFCDDDDLWAPNKLRRQLDEMSKTGAEWCTASAIHVDQNLRPIGGERLKDARRVTRSLREQNVVPGGGSGVLMRRSLFESVGGFSESARFVEDWDLWIRLSERSPVACVDELLVAYRMWPISFSHHAFDMQHAAFCALVESVNVERSDVLARPKTAGIFEVRQRLASERRRSVAKELPRLLKSYPGEALPILLMLGLPNSLITALRLRRVGRADIRAADRWLDVYRTAVIADLGLPQ